MKWIINSNQSHPYGKYFLIKSINLIPQVIFPLFLLFSSIVYCQELDRNVIEASNISLWVSSDGFHDRVIGNAFCSEYPKGTSVGALSTEGVAWGGKVFDGEEKIVRVSGSTYSSANSPLSKVFKVRTNYFEADLTNDATSFFRVSRRQVTDSMKTAIYNKYENDWKEWPAEKGAPFFDINNNGIYESDIDIPGVPGAAQTLWINYNDDKSERDYKSPIIGLDVRETYWAYDYYGILGNVIYKKVEIIYKGIPTTPSDSRIDSMYICQFADTDIGSAVDDYSGCDTTLNLGYSYNYADYDAIYSKYLPAPPAIGYSILNGAAYKSDIISDSAIVNFKLRKGYKFFNSKPLTVFVVHRTASGIPGPGYDYTGALEFYNLMRGYSQSPPYPASKLFKRPLEFGGNFGGYGTYFLDGDPITRQGWIDGLEKGPSVRYFWATTGPMNMKLGDTVEVVVMLAGGLGDTHLSSITELKKNVKGATEFFKNFVEEMTTGKVTIPNIQRPFVELSPANYKLTQNYPNPFNGFTTIKYECPKEAQVKLIIYDVLGRKVKTLVNEIKPAGTYEEKFNPGNLSSGMYFYKISFENSDSKLVYDELTKVKKMILMK